MTEEVSKVQVETEDVSEHRVTTHSKSVKDYFVFRRRLVYWVLGGFTVTLLFGALAFVGLFREQQSIADAAQKSVANLTEDVTLLREQLGDAQRQLNANRQEETDRTSCRNAYNNTVSENTSNILVELTQLLALLANDVPNDTATAVAEIEAAGVVLQQAQTDRKAYEAQGAPLPCPITVAVTEPES